MPNAVAHFEVSIPYSSSSGDQGHTIYSIDVVEHELGLAYTVGRRFSEFDALRECLMLESDQVPLSSSFPPKRWFWNMAPEVVEDRRQQLEIWLQEAFLLLARDAQNELERQLFQFIDATSRLEQLEAERRAAKLRKMWGRVQRPAVCGPTTRLHIFASTGQVELLRNALRELRGDHDWLPTVDQSRNAPATAYDPVEDDRIVGLLDTRSNPTEASILQAEGGATLDTLPLPPERAGPAETVVGTDIAVNGSTEVVVGVAGFGLHSELSVAPHPSLAPQRTKTRPLGTLDAGDSTGRSAFVLACGAGHRECVRALVLAECSTELVDCNDMTGWDWAITPPGQPLVVEELEKLAGQRNENHQADSGTALKSAVATPPLVMESKVKQLDSGRFNPENSIGGKKHSRRSGKKVGRSQKRSTYTAHAVI